MKNRKSKILKVDFGRCKADLLVDASTEVSSSSIDSNAEYTDIALYKLAQQYAELKRVSGYKNVRTKDEYKFLSQKTQ